MHHASNIILCMHDASLVLSRVHIIVVYSMASISLRS